MAADTITSLLPWSVLAPLLGISYLSLCHALRYRQRDKTLARYPYRSREDLAKMTNQHAFEIQKGLYATEFPFTMEKALQFALFRYVFFFLSAFCVFGAGWMVYVPVLNRRGRGQKWKEGISLMGGQDVWDTDYFATAGRHETAKPHGECWKGILLLLLR
jgi:hypothetical protein